MDSDDPLGRAVHNALARSEGELEATCRWVLSQNPAHPAALGQMTRLLRQRGDAHAALELIDAAIAQQSENASLHSARTHFLKTLRRTKEGLHAARRATDLGPLDAVNWINRAAVAVDAEAYDEAIECCGRALALDPTRVEAWVNRAAVELAKGDAEAACLSYRRALALSPEIRAAQAGLLLASLHLPQISAEAIAQEAKALVGQIEQSKPALTLSPVPGRRLQVGFIGGDFSAHAVMHFAMPVMLRLAATQFEVSAYSTSANSDAVTHLLRHQLKRYVVVGVEQPEAGAQRIRDDGIDILIDLAGHTAQGAIAILALAPAPVLVTWLGYPGTTGLRTVRWRITDGVADGPRAQAEYTEGLVRLPGCFCVYRPHIRDARAWKDPRYEVVDTPALARGRMTLGSCNSLPKLTRETIALWARCLRSLPGAELRIEARGVENEQLSGRLRRWFSEEGIAPERLVWVNRDSRAQYLTYHQVDIALDPLPVSGGTTTFDALWMGVPVVTLVGESFRGRISASVLMAGGWPEDVTTNADDFVRRVCALAADPEALNRQRHARRPQMQASVLMDEARFARLFGQALRLMWTMHCAAQEPQRAAAQSTEQAEPARTSEAKPAHEALPSDDDLTVLAGSQRITMKQARALLGEWNEVASRKALETNSASAAGERAQAQGHRARVLARAVLTVAPEDLQARGAFGH